MTLLARCLHSRARLPLTAVAEYSLHTMDECTPPPAKKPCPDDSDPAVLNSHLCHHEEPIVEDGVLKEGSGSNLEVVQAGVRTAKKRYKFALLLSYSGKGYMGMQKNPGVRTIEEDLLEAMCKAEAFPESMVADLGKLHFQRCARTDKGVSAARQLVSIKHMVDLKDARALINAHLPAQIRIMSVKRVTKSFDSHHACNARMYEYLLPTYAFAPYHLSTPDYRVPDERVQMVDKCLKQFVGTHNYHNFTSGKKFNDMSSNRYIMSFQSGERFVATDSVSNVEGGNVKKMEFIPLRVKGQSFVLHQIRKMIGFVIAIVRGLVREEDFDKAFAKEKFDIPKAPALGLFLENVYFDRYNTKFAKNGERARLEWTEQDEDVTEFKKNHIYRTIIETEIKEMSMMQWLHTLQLHNFHETAARLKAVAGSQDNSGTENTTPSLDSSNKSPSLDKASDLTGVSSDLGHTSNTSPDAPSSDLNCALLNTDSVSN